MTSIRSRRVWVIVLALPALACGRGEPQTVAQEFITDTGTTAPVAAGGPQVLVFGKAGPIDQAGFHPEFLTYRNELLAVAQRRDTLALYRLVAPDVKASFGGDAGIEGLRTVYRLGSPDSEFWTVLTDVLTHGGRFATDNDFTAPWTFDALPDSLDVFTHLIVREDGVPVHASPDVASPMIATLSYDIVRAAGFNAGAAWREVELVGGGTGYIEAARVRSPVDHRAIFERRGGRWLLVAFVSGD